MIVSGFVLFLFGTAVSAGPYIAPVPTEIVVAKNQLHSSERVAEYYHSSDKSPFISNFVQKGTNVFFKPQFIMSAAQMPPQIQTMIAEIEKDDCKTSYPMGPVPVLPIIEEPLRVIEKEFIAPPDVKEVIEINPIKPMAIPYAVTMPEAPVLLEQPCEVPQVVLPEAPVLPAYLPKVEVPAPMVPVVVEVEKPRVIPPAPVLPPLEMPKIPMMVEEIPVAPVPRVPVVVEIEQPKEIVLPVIPPAPVLPPMELPKLEEPCIQTEIIQDVPEPYVREVLIEEKAPVLPSLEPVSVVIEEVKPVVIPPAPVLPPMEVPKMPVIVEEASIIPCPPAEEIHVSKPFPLPAPILPSYVPEVVISQPTPMVIEEKPIVIPQPPELPAFVMPKLPEVIVQEDTVEITEKHVEPIVIPEAPLLPPMVITEIEKLPLSPALPCDTVEVVEKHVEPIVIPEAPLLPPLAPIEIPRPVIIEEPLHIEIQKEIVPPVVIPPAPVLRPLEIPELPKIVVPEPCDTVEIVEKHVEPIAIPEAPLLPPLAPVEIPRPIIIDEPLHIEIQKEIVPPVVIPPAPVLSPLEIPEFTKVVVPEPCDTVEIVEKHVEPAFIPTAPLQPALAPMAPMIVQEKIKPVVLPPVFSSYEIPRGPIIVKRPVESLKVEPCPPEQEVILEKRPVMTMPFPYTKPFVLPETPMVPQYYVPYVHQKVVKSEPVKVEKNSLLPFAKDCAQDIVVSRILPKMGMGLRTNAAPVAFRYAPYK